ncbi:hypothetical protein [Parafrankia sp. EUN1f]|uniref:hypothetical protein n=1 Tax=Parafrankia sp. EUN1f TaxID=102897 RepID=UPI0005634E93|nr:hypothetical protein [Parafrankia sp. EUN1f]
MQTLAPDPELELKTLLGDLYVSYTDPDAPGTASLLNRLTIAYRHRLGPRTRGERGHRPPGPRPPGADGAMLARDEIEQIVDWWAYYLHPGEPTLTRMQAADLLPTLAVQQRAGELADEVVHDIRSAHRVALLVLGIVAPPVVIRGAWCPACERQSISTDLSATEGKYWCGNGGFAPGACHDDARWPDCRDPDTGILACRRSPRSRRHCHFYDHADLDRLRTPPASRRSL